MSSFRVDINPTTAKVAGVKRWCLDYPATEQQITSAELTEQGLVFQGWVLPEQLQELQDLQIEVSHGDESTLFGLNVARPDVIRIVLKAEAEGHPQLYCGFRFTLQLQAAQFNIGFRIAGLYTEIWRGMLHGEFKVLRGLDDWLFLDNDTNQSVEQHVGRLLLEPQCQHQWRLYFSQSQHYQRLWQVPFALLIAPSKEAVYPQFHPKPRAELTAIEQLLAITPVGYPLVYPQSQLRAATSPSFPKTDTHWTTFGASLASVELAVKLGISREQVTTLFAADHYREISQCGDLGNKLFPQQRSNELLQASFSCYKNIVYDNKLPNFGRIMVVFNPNALHEGHCLQFGSSSSYSMLNFQTRIFQLVTLIHTAGNVDPTMVDLFQPDVVVSQTNARFVVRAPVMDYQLRAIMQQKLAMQSVEERQALLAAAQKMAELTELPTALLAHQLLLDALDALPKDVG